MKKYMMAMFLLHCTQEPLYADYFGPVEYAVFALLMIGIVRESDNFFEKKTPKFVDSKFADLKQYKIPENKISQMRVLPELELQSIINANLNLASIISKKMYARPPLKQSGSLRKSWVPLKSRKFC